LSERDLAIYWLAVPGTARAVGLRTARVETSRSWTLRAFGQLALLDSSRFWTALRPMSSPAPSHNERANDPIEPERVLRQLLHGLTLPLAITVPTRYKLRRLLALTNATHNGATCIPSTSCRRLRVFRRAMSRAMTPAPTTRYCTQSAILNESHANRSFAPPLATRS
jgi:hypothetical protein